MSPDANRYRVAASFIAGVLLAVIGAFTIQTLTAGAAGANQDESSFVPISPCRLVDTRPDFRIGPHGGFGADDTRTINAHGDNGECTIPTSAVGLSMNVTAVSATESTNIRIWPSGAIPNAASLNPAPGQVVFNAVSTQLSDTGAFNVYNRFGSVHLIIDVNGYHTPTPLGAVAASAHSGDVSPIPSWETGGAVLVSTTLTAPGDGKVTVTASAHLYNMVSEDFSAGCTISTDGADDGEYGFYPDGSASSVRVFDVVEGDTNTFSLVCWGENAHGASNNNISAIYTPAA